MKEWGGNIVSLLMDERARSMSREFHCARARTTMLHR